MAKSHVHDDFAKWGAFADFVSHIVGTNKWFVGRWSKKRRLKYEARISPKRYSVMRAQWEAKHPRTLLIT